MSKGVFYSEGQIVEMVRQATADLRDEEEAPERSTAPGQGSNGKDDEPTVTSKRLEDLILDMLKSGGRINDQKEAAKVRSMLAVEMDGNNRRKFLDVARAVLMTRARGEGIGKF